MSGKSGVMRGRKAAATEPGKLLRRAWIKHAAKTHR